MALFIHVIKNLSAFPFLSTTANFYLAAPVKLKSLTIVMVESLQGPFFLPWILLQCPLFHAARRRYCT